ncbi:MAG: PAS domain S-box protein [Actinomycetota bacterium]
MDLGEIETGLDDTRGAEASRRAACACGVLCALVGATALAGCAADMPLLRSWTVAWVASQPWSGVGFCLAGLAVIGHCRDRPSVEIPAALALGLIGALSLAKHLAAFDLGIDRLLFPDAVAMQAVRWPGRMAGVTAMMFVLLAAALGAGRLPATRRHAWVVKTLGLGLAVAGAMGYLFGAVRLSALGSYAPFALPSAVAFTLAFLGANLAEPEAGWVRLVTSARLGGTIMRRLVPVAVVLPVAVGVIVLLALGDTDIQPGFRLALAMLIVMFGLSVIIGWVARRLDQVDEQRLRALAAVARTQARHRAVVETAVDAMMVVNDQGEILSVNRAAERIFGWQPTEILGRHVSTLVPSPETKLGRDNGVGRVVRARRRDGSLFPADLAIADWHDDRRRFHTWIMRDVSQAFQAERELRRSEARFRTIFDQAAVGMEQVSLADGRLLAVNRRLCAMLGYEATDLRRMDFRTLTAPAFHDEEEALLAELVRAHRESYVIEKQYLRQDGSPLWVRVTSSIPEGEAYRISIIEDISEQRRAVAAVEQATIRLQEALEETRQARDEAERANRAKSTFLAAASHDLRQPVQAMVLLNAALAARLEGHPAAEIVTRLSASVNALQMLLEGLLDVSRLDAGVVEASPTDIPVGELLNRLCSEYAVRCRPKGLRLRVVACSAWTRSDPALLERILRNLLENAVRYTEHGSILLGCRRRGDMLHIGVWDTGIGIAEDKQALIFQEFYQLSNPERDRDKGLGLGLSIVQRLAQLLGHRLLVTSVPDRGSAFVVEVPMVRPCQAEPEQAADADEHPNGAVLVIDDEALLRESLATALSDGGWSVRTAADADEAVDQASAHPPDVILADYRLRGGATGIGAAKLVEAACGRTIPTIVLTGDTDPERIAEVQRSGYRIVHKPVVPDKLKELLRASARGH